MTVESAARRPTIVVDRPVDEVFALMSDLDRAAAWAPQMGPVVERTGPVAEGMTFGEVRRFLGRRSVARWTVTGYVPSRLIAFRLRWGLMSGDFAYHFEPHGGSSTRITQDVALHLAGPLALLSGMLTSEALKEESRELVRLKALIEGGATGSF